MYRVDQRAGVGDLAPCRYAKSDHTQHTPMRCRLFLSILLHTHSHLQHNKQQPYMPRGSYTTGCILKYKMQRAAAAPRRRKLRELLLNILIEPRLIIIQRVCI
jgi:hypothetical protein